MLEFEAGAHPVDASYAAAAAEGRPIRRGFSTSWAVARMGVLSGQRRAGVVAESACRQASWQRVSTPEETAQIIDRLGSDLAAGALGIGVLVGYTPRTGVEEHLAVARNAAVAGVPTYTHARYLVEFDPATVIDRASEIVEDAANRGRTP